MKIIDECTERTRKLMKEKRHLVQGLSELLLEKETIDLKQIVSVLGERPFKAKANYKAFLEEVKLNLKNTVVFFVIFIFRLAPTRRKGKARGLNIRIL